MQTVGANVCVYSPNPETCRNPMQAALSPSYSPHTGSRCAIIYLSVPRTANVTESLSHMQTQTEINARCTGSKKRAMTKRALDNLFFSIRFQKESQVVTCKENIAMI
ncbi:hypothetical protein XENORESO_010549 [Xenotaenia resolanae]|uniref:Uncharacterized protein n=1 Tax=Xenotaenia resolanae TaxID=208358 RepID=A0ABV0X0H2_9TELE